MLGILLFCCVILISCILFYTYFVKPFSYWSDRGVVQTTPKWVFGDNWNVITGQESLFDTVRRIYRELPNKRYVGLYQFTQPILMIKDIELIKQITVKDFEHFVDHRQWVPETSDYYWSQNLFALRGDKWKEMRTFLTPAFTGRKMRAMYSLIKDSAQRFVKHFEERADDTLELDFRDICNRFSCDVIATTAFGVEVDSLKHPNNDFYKYGEEAGDFTGIKMLIFFVAYFMPSFLIKLLNIKVFSKKVTNFFYGLVEETITTREKNKIHRPDMIHLMMEAKKGKHEYDVIDDEQDVDFAIQKLKSFNSNMSDSKIKLKITNKDITAQAMVFIIGGYETSSILLRFMFYELAVNPDTQQKLRDEINEVVSNSEDDVTYEKLKNMKYLDMVVTETLRKWPPGFLIDRICTKPFTITPKTSDEKERTIDVGTMIWIPVGGLHHDPQYYPDPEKFYPERFSEENNDKINPYTYLPFGTGPRSCIGNRFAILESKVLLFHVLKSFEIFPVEKTRIPLVLTKKNFNLDAENFILGVKKLK